jgi:hypothetical protein
MIKESALVGAYKNYCRRTLNAKEFCMLEFVRKNFRSFFGFCLWLNLILFAIIGGACGNILGRGGSIFLGLIIGVLIGLIINVIGDGLIATFLEMSEDIKKITAGNVSNGSNTVAGLSVTDYYNRGND